MLDLQRIFSIPGWWERIYDYEQIHDDLALHAAVVYDFIFDFLHAHPHPDVASLGKATKSVAEEVFKRFIDLGMIRGSSQGNWNVNGWNMLLRPILVLDTDDCYEDGKGRDYYVRFLTQQSVSGQGTFDALFGSVAGGKRSGVCRFI